MLSDDDIKSMRDLATASTAGRLQWGQAESSDCAELHIKTAALDGTPADKVWTTWAGDKDDSLITAITGNGATSEANAKFYSVARGAVLALLDEVAELRGRLPAASKARTMPRRTPKVAPPAGSLWVSTWDNFPQSLIRVERIDVSNEVADCSLWRDGEWRAGYQAFLGNFGADPGYQLADGDDFVDFGVPSDLAAHGIVHRDLKPDNATTEGQS